MPRIVVKNGVHEGTSFWIRGSSCMLGRGISCDVRLSDRNISRNHAVILLSSNNEYMIRDSGSSFGTYVNGSKITEKSLKDRDIITLGRVEVIFRQKDLGTRKEPGERIPLADDAESKGEEEFTILQTLSDRDQPADLIPLTPGTTTEEKNIDLKKRMKTIYEVSEAIAFSFDLPKLYRKILDVIFATLKVERAQIMLIDAESGIVVPQASLDSEGHEKEVPYSTTIVNKCIRHGHSLLLNNAQADQAFDSAMSVFAQNIRSALCVPIRNKKEVIGVINADATGASQFTRSDLQLLTLIGNQAGTVIQNARLAEENIKAARLAAVGQTVASLAHCIKNILQGLKGGAFMVDEGLKNDNQEMIEAAWPLVKGSQEKITELVMNMLDYSKDRKPAYKKSDLRESMKNILDLMTERAKEKNVSVKLSYSQETPEVDCDPMGIYRATLNLVTNAIDASPSDDGKIMIEVAPSDDCMDVLISVTDNGHGIPPDVESKLFEAFHSTKDSKGTGLGLCVSKKIAKEHGGDIIVETEQGKGTRFTIQIPVNKTGCVEA